MKKIVLILIVCFGIGFTSCKKDRSCTCITYSTCLTCEITSVTSNVKSTKRKAKTKCEALQSKVVEPTQTFTTVCELD